MLVIKIRDLFSKGVLKLDSWSLYWILSCFGAVLMLPLFFLGYFGAFGPYTVTADYAWILTKASVSHTIYNLVSFLILSYLHPISHAIGNAMRRIVIIFFALIWFRNPISSVNILGTLLACGGVIIYSYYTTKPTPKVSQNHEIAV
jgi:solute carrier family 35, member E1